MRWIGAVLIVLGCGSGGYGLAAAYRREEALLRQLFEVNGWLQCELRCRATDLPGLFYRAAERTEGTLGQLFEQLSRELSNRVAPDVISCMEKALGTVCLPEKLRRGAVALGRSLGEFDMDGQLRQLEALEAECSRLLEEHTRNRDSRIRTYQTLGLCGGLALAIILL